MDPRDYLARNARDPHVAGVLVGASALVFTTGWLLVRSVAEGFGSGAELAYFWGFFLLVTPPNAYLVTRLCWRR